MCTAPEPLDFSISERYTLYSQMGMSITGNNDATALTQYRSLKLCSLNRIPFQNDFAVQMAMHRLTHAAMRSVCDNRMCLTWREKN